MAHRQFGRRSRLSSCVADRAQHGLCPPDVQLGTAPDVQGDVVQIYAAAGEQFRLTISVPAGNELHEPVTASEALLTLLPTSATPMALLPEAPRCAART